VVQGSNWGVFPNQDAISSSRSFKSRDPGMYTPEAVAQKPVDDLQSAQATSKQVRCLQLQYFCQHCLLKACCEGGFLRLSFADF